MRAKINQNLTKIIDQHWKISCNITKQIEIKNFESGRILDNELMENFSLILVYEPVDAKEDIFLIKFLLEVLAPSNMRSPIAALICHKLAPKFD